MFCAIAIVLAIMLYCYFEFRKERYYPDLPTSDAYPSNHDEISEVELAISQRTEADVRAHYLTDASVIPMFINVLRHHGVYETESRLEKITNSAEVQTFVMGLKKKHNRARPWQIKNIDHLPSVTAHTASYPAGHAYQAWLLCQELTAKYPALREVLHATAEYCDRVRVVAGLHYPSDGRYSKALVFAS